MSMGVRDGYAERQRGSRAPERISAGRVQLGNLMRRIHVRQAIEVGLENSEAELAADVAQVRSEFGLPGIET